MKLEYSLSFRGEIAAWYDTFLSWYVGRLSVLET